MAAVWEGDSVLAAQLVSWRHCILDVYLCPTYCGLRANPVLPPADAATAQVGTGLPIPRGRPKDQLHERARFRHVALRTERTCRDWVVRYLKCHRGQLLDVRITRAGTFTLYGDPAIVGL